MTKQNSKEKHNVFASLLHGLLCHSSCNNTGTQNRNLSSYSPDLRTVGSVTLLPLTYVSASSHGSSTTTPSPEGPVLLVKMQCSSLMKCPLRTMSCLQLASSRPTLEEMSQRLVEVDFTIFPAHINEEPLLGGSVFDVVQ